MDDWRNLILAGNQYFAIDEMEHAEDNYFDALTLLDENSESLFTDREKLSAWLACHHNLATVYKQSDQSELARFHLESPLEIIEVQLKKASPDHHHFVELLKAYSAGLSELVVFKQTAQRAA
ncbi:hypothetical protein D515_03724 [Grimontia indica]|uniref:TPR repeat protein n=1 Tax=Grimontia indica TaxID=1056512 RepID=R1IQG6_9GAMM|nr:hypothetical protein [Grimontia indica]EOD77600.1 hypothetical protein D515_03724 [Grimontia indica]